jgi:hypothetical protein
MNKKSFTRRFTRIRTALIVTAALVLTGCPQPTDDGGGSVTLQGISVTTQPTKTSYALGQAFSSAGLVVSAGYSNGTSSVITSACTLTWNAAALAENSTAITAAIGNKTIIVTYQDKTANFTITVATALEAAINTANAAKLGILVDTDAANVPAGSQWVTQAEMTALTNAITAAQAVKNKPAATVTEVNDAVTALNSAVSAFNEAKKNGTNTTIVAADKTALTNAIDAAETALTAAEVNEAADPSGVPEGVTYISAADKTAYQAAITAANAVNINAAATQTEVDAAVSTLDGAITGKIKTGTKLPALTGSVTITGTAKAGETLTADTGDLDGSGTISYQWIRNTTDIGGATAPTYTLIAADTGKTIKVRVSRTGYSDSVTSDPTAEVAAGIITTQDGLAGYLGSLAANTAATPLHRSSGRIGYYQYH